MRLGVLLAIEVSDGSDNERDDQDEVDDDQDRYALNMAGSCGAQSEAAGCSRCSPS